MPLPPPSTLVDVAVLISAIRSGSASVAYSYSEATTYIEYMIDTARLALRWALERIHAVEKQMAEAESKAKQEARLREACLLPPSLYGARMW